jgi:exodeoxyribonuclease VII large subunit
MRSVAAVKPYSVSDLLRDVNLQLYRFNDVSVEGEVTNYVRSAAGHSYFTLKDARAQIKVVLFATNARFLRFRIENGLQLIVRGRLTIYEAKGDFQLNAVAAEPAGVGALQLAFEQLKKQLAAEGLFDPARKKPIPMLPQRIAVVTSPTGAAIRDILHVLGRRFENLSLQIYPVRVQGATAGREIAAAVRHLSKWKLHDVVLICRGGGSLEDLWAFNEEVVARAVAECEIPTISGVGHETDFTICDFVADLRQEPLALYPARIERQRQRLRATMATLQAVSPLSVLSRGYAIAFSRTRRGRKPILDSSQVKVGEQIEVQLKRGRVEATVDRHTLGVESVWPEVL